MSKYNALCTKCQSIISYSTMSQSLLCVDVFRLIKGFFSALIRGNEEPNRTWPDDSCSCFNLWLELPSHSISQPRGLVQCRGRESNCSTALKVLSNRGNKLLGSVLVPRQIPVGSLSLQRHRRMRFTSVIIVSTLSKTQTTAIKPLRDSALLPSFPSLWLMS